MLGGSSEGGFGQINQPSYDDQDSSSPRNKPSHAAERIEPAEELPSSKRSFEKGHSENASVPEASRVTASEPSHSSGEQVLLESQQADASEALPSPRLPASTNRTPTQADYADYFRRGSSPTAIIPQGSTRHESFERTSPGQQPAIPQSMNDADTIPTLKSRFYTPASNQVSDQAPPSYTDQTNFPHESSLNHPDEPQRASEDSDGTFQTAKSNAAVDNAMSTGYPHQQSENEDQEKPADVQVRKSSGRSSRSVATPGAVPAANIRDQPTSRPFSFIQFSQSPGPQPLENYPHRQPSIDSTPSGISSEHDVPPSPVSPQQSFFHEPVKREQIQPGVGRDYNPANTKSTPHYPSHSFSRPFQEPEHQGQRIPRGDGPPMGDDMPAQHYPAPLPRQEVVIPRQQTTEYSLEGVGPPTKPRPTNSTSSSKRGSRSSAFFRSFRNPTENKASDHPGDSDGPESNHSQDHPQMRKSSSKRGSLFRTLTKSSKANSSEDTLQKQRGTAPPVSTPKQNQPIADTTEKHNPPIQSPSKYRNRLSRPAAPKVVEQPPQEPGKKKRFSGIGVRYEPIRVSTGTDFRQSLFGRSKDQKGSRAPPNSVPQAPPAQGSGQPQDRDNRLSSIKDQRTRAPSTERASSHDNQYNYTRDSLAKEGLLPQTTKRPSSKSPEPSAYSQTSAQHQQAYPPRHQSLSQGVNGQSSRSPGWSRQSSTTNANSPPPQQPVPLDQRHRVLSSITTRTTTNPSGAQQTVPRPQHFSSTTTTTTTTSRAPNDRSRQQSLGNSFARSESPPPPPPPPKDTWHQPRQHQRSQSNISNTSMGRTSIEPPPSSQDRLFVPAQTYTTTSMATSNNPPPQQRSKDPRSSPSVVRQPQPSPSPSPSLPPPQHSLPPLQTTNFSSSPAPNPRTTTFTDPSLEARKLRRSQIESMVSPSSATPTNTSATTAASDPGEARRVRRSQIESIGPAPRNNASAPMTSTNTTTSTHTHTTTTNAGGGSNKEAVATEEGRGRRVDKEKEDEDEPIVMSATSFPGQEWQPSGFAWEGD
ncbi:MAG: hypothetical protein Q9222_006802 [Ikaeria aurantiellina]